MPRPAVAALLLAPAVGLVVIAGGLRPPPARAADPAAVDRLVAQLADQDYGRRERAGRALDALGPDALDALRTAARSANPEQARRAAVLAERIDRRLANARALAPTVVALRVDQAPLAAVLADLSHQSEIPVVLGGSHADELADDPVTLATGRVPFWEAVRAVCLAADLQVRAVAGYPSRGAGPEPGDAPAGAVVLEERGSAPRRPAVVFGGVLVEAVPVPVSPPPADAAVTLLLVWPEPKLNWQATGGLRVDRALTPAGRELLPFPDLIAPPAADRPPIRPFPGRRLPFEELPVLPPPPPLVPGFTPSPRQAVVRLRPGAAPPARADLTGVVLATVRAGPEPLVRLDGLTPGAAAEGGHPAGVDVRAVVAEKAGRWELTADVLIDPYEVFPVGSEPGAGAGFRDARVGLARAVLQGLRAADAGGGEFDLLATQYGRPFRADLGRLSVRVVAVLSPSEGRPPTGPPSSVTFVGSYNRGVEVPVALAGVPLTGGHGK